MTVTNKNIVGPDSARHDQYWAARLYVDLDNEQSCLSLRDSQTRVWECMQKLLNTHVTRHVHVLPDSCMFACSSWSTQAVKTACRPPRGHGFKSRSSLNFFRFSFYQLLKLMGHHSSFRFLSVVDIYDYFTYSLLTAWSVVQIIFDESPEQIKKCSMMVANVHFGAILEYPATYLHISHGFKERGI